MDLEEHSPHVFAPHACLEYDISCMAHRLHSIIVRFYEVFRKYKVYQFVSYTHTERQRQCRWQRQTGSHWNTLWRLGMGLELIFKRHHSVIIDQYWMMLPLMLMLTLGVGIPLNDLVIIKVIVEKILKYLSSLNWAKKHQPFTKISTYWQNKVIKILT